MTTATRRRTAEAEGTTRAWQDGVQAMVSGYGEQWRRAVELSMGWWNPRCDNRELVGENVRRIAEGTREVASAQAAIAGEWLRAPFWLAGAGSPADLQARYVRLLEAQRDLARAVLTAAVEFQRTVAGATERAADTAREAVDTGVQTARRVADDVREVQQGAVAAVRDAAESTRRTTERVVEQAREAAEGAAEQAVLAQRPIKGNVNSRGEKLYHLPGQSSYERTQPEETFATEAEAQAAGYRRSEAPGGGRIKGKISREGERIYHLPGQANYDRIDEADFLFETEEAARAAGFRPAQR